MCRFFSAATASRRLQAWAWASSFGKPWHRFSSTCSSQNGFRSLMTSSRSLFQGSKSSLSVSPFVFSSSFSVSLLLVPSFSSQHRHHHRHHHRRLLRYLNLHIFSHTVRVILFCFSFQVLFLVWKACRCFFAVKSFGTTTVSCRSLLKLRLNVLWQNWQKCVIITPS